MNPIDKFLNNITMYRTVEYGLLVVVGYSLIASLFGLLSFTPLELILTLLTVTFVCYFGNILLAKIFRATINNESSIITALILYFLVWPSTEISQILLIALFCVIAMASKYIFTIRRKHIFNPAALAAVLVAFIGAGALWWVGTPIMLPVTLIVGLLIVRKIRRFTMFFTFLAVSLVVFFTHVIFKGLNPVEELITYFSSFPVIFFGTIMLTEPLTTPPTRKLQMVYASIVGIIFAWQGALGPIILTSELALVLGNIFSYAVSPKSRLYLHLSKKKTLAENTEEFSFIRPRDFKFKPGQYLEWTLPMKKTDGRGNRRYFTIASSPSEPDLKLGIRFNDPSSAFKKRLQEISEGDIVVGSQLAGDFTLPKSSQKSLVFIAGGIGITPFRSMIQDMVDGGDKREVILFYSNKTESEIAYREVLAQAQEKLGITIVYLLSDEKSAPQNWNGEKGRLTQDMIKKYVKNPTDNIFYLSGPVAMVDNYKKILSQIGVGKTSIVTDYFPGF